jgi:hypothetical protein
MKIKSQLYSDAEAQKKVGAILDDCGPSSAAAAVAYVNCYAPDLQASDGVAAKARATGFVERQGVSDNGSSLSELMKTVRELGAKARPADTFAEAVEAAKCGAALLIWAQAPIGYPKQALSKWHRNWEKYWQKKDPKVVEAGYGHMTSASFDAPNQTFVFADPTFDERDPNEQFAVPVTEAELKAIASGKPGSPASHIVIVTRNKKGNP